MSRCDASLSGLLWNQEEIEALIVLLVFHKLRINDATRCWVLSVSISALDKHPLVNSLVHDDKSNLGQFVLVELGDGLIELRHFFLEDLLTLGVSNSIPVDDEVRWHLTRVLALEDFDGFLYSRAAGTLSLN